jgi:kynurenine formamidase
MYWRRGVLGIGGLMAAFALGWLAAGWQVRAEKAADVDSKAAIKGWKKGTGWGWIWGKDDEVGALNGITPAAVKAAAGLVKEGKVFDLGIAYDRASFKWHGHSPCEVVLFRGPEGVKRQGDHDFITDPKVNVNRLGWHSCAVFINDNVGTQIDGLAHITVGEDNHWYNGFKEADWGGNFGVRKCDAVSIPPIVTRGVLLDVAAFRGLEVLPPHYAITAEELKACAEKQGTELRPGDAVLVRTGAMRFWGENGKDHANLGKHDSAGIDLTAARWLVEEKGAVLIANDTSSLERGPAPGEKSRFIPVHQYLLVEQGVHIGEFHFLEDLARTKTYEFCYVCTTNKIRGTTAGFTLRPIAIR